MNKKISKYDQEGIYILITAGIFLSAFCLVMYLYYCTKPTVHTTTLQRSLDTYQEVQMRTLTLTVEYAYAMGQLDYQAGKTNAIATSNGWIWVGSPWDGNAKPLKTGGTTNLIEYLK